MRDPGDLDGSVARMSAALSERLGESLQVRAEVRWTEDWCLDEYGDKQLIEPPSFEPYWRVDISTRTTRPRMEFATFVEGDCLRYEQEERAVNALALCILDERSSR